MKDNITRILHWTFGCFVIGMIGLGFYMTNTDYNLDLYNLHKPLGIIFGMLIGFRLYWRIKHPWQSSTPLSTFENKARYITHLLLVVLFIAMPLSGFLSSAYSGWGVQLFNIEIVSQNINQTGDVVPYNETIYLMAKNSHKVLSYFFSVLIFMHIVAILYHHFIKKDRTLIDMLKNRF